jgi:S-adenosylmethionine synthetase
MSAPRSWIVSSESVTEGHPDKVADAISDGVLDAFLADDPSSLVACETLVTTGLVLLAGEVSTSSAKHKDFQSIVRGIITRIGYTHAGQGFDADSCAVLNTIHEQSRDIRQGVAQEKDIGAGDQGMMFGYACDETATLMPAPIAFAHGITKKLADLRKSGEVKWLRPDGKAQVSVEYRDGRPVAIGTIVVSTQHDEQVSQDEIRDTVKKKVIASVLPKELLAKDPVLHVNPTGRFVIGGPHGDSGLTGRKIIVDTYGGMAPHGGGAFSGKDPTKVDRSAAYMARYIAKNVVAAGLASRFQIQVAYAIGVAEPVSVYTESFGTSQVDPVKLEKTIREIFPLTPAGLIRHLDLRRPIYSATTAYGHFGREDGAFPWEKTDKAAELKKAFGA